MNTENIKRIKKEILKISFIENLGHIPSALSLVAPLLHLSQKIGLSDRLFIGKPYGAQAYSAMEYLFPAGTFPARIGSALFGVSNGTKSTDTTLAHTIGRALGYAQARQKDKGQHYVVMGDSAFFEGTVSEALSLAGELGLSNLTLVIDNNSFGVTSRNKSSDRITAILKAYGWSVDKKSRTKPSAFIFNSEKGEDLSFMSGDPSWHYQRLTAELYEQALEELA